MMAMRWMVLATLVVGCVADPSPAGSGGAAGGGDASATETGTSADTAVGGTADGGPVDGGAVDGAGATDGQADVVPVDAPPADVGPVPCSDAELKNCNDGLGCTADTCAVVAGKPVCAWKLDANACLRDRNRKQGWPRGRAGRNRLCAPPDPPATARSPSCAG